MLSSTAIAAPEQQAAAFMNIYSTHCLKYLHDFDALRKQLTAFPQLPAEAAAMFLQGAKGSAWSVPSQHGQFVLVVHDDKNLCALYAKTLPAATTKALFEKTVGKAPEPFRSERKRNTSDKGPDGVKSTVAYEWSTEQSPRKPLFALTTTTSKNSVAQGVATAAIGR